MQEMLPNLVILKYMCYSDSICNAVHVDSINEYINPSVNPSLSPWVCTGNSFHPSRDPRLLRSFDSFPAVVAHGGAGCRGLCGAVDVSKRKLFEPERVVDPIGGLPLMFGVYSLDTCPLVNPNRFVHYLLGRKPSHWIGSV